MQTTEHPATQPLRNLEGRTLKERTQAQECIKDLSTHMQASGSCKRERSLNPTVWHSSAVLRSRSECSVPLKLENLLARPAQA